MAPAAIARLAPAVTLSTWCGDDACASVAATVHLAASSRLAQAHSISWLKLRGRCDGGAAWREADVNLTTQPAAAISPLTARLDVTECTASAGLVLLLYAQPRGELLHSAWVALSSPAPPGFEAGSGAPAQYQHAVELLPARVSGVLLSGAPGNESSVPAAAAATLVGPGVRAARLGYFADASDTVSATYVCTVEMGLVPRRATSSDVALESNGAINATVVTPCPVPCSTPWYATQWAQRGVWCTWIRPHSARALADADAAAR